MTGSIEKRGKNSYRLVVFKGYDLDGRPIRHQKTIHCKKKSEAQIELAKFLTEVESGLIVDGNIPTFAQYVEIWTKDYALKELAPSTYYRYKRLLETRITAILILAACTAFNGFCLAKVWEFVKEEIVKPLFGAKR